MEAVFLIIGAMVGAGFASGREMMQFFSQYGPLSWFFIAVSGAVMGLLMLFALEKQGAVLPQNWAGRGFLLLLYFAAAGGMTAAAGALAALTLPLPQARGLGSLLTLGGCWFFSRKPLGTMARLAMALLPLLVGAFLLCLKLPASGEAEAPCFQEAIKALLRVVGYSGLNVTLSLGALAQAAQGKSPWEKRKTAWGAAAGLTGLLLLGNGALMPQGRAMAAAALPMVALLREYGKAGFYLAAAALYLAVVTTLAALLLGLDGLLAPWVSRAGVRGWLILPVCLAGSALGFESIVAHGYPLLGWVGILLLLGTRSTEKREEGGGRR